MAEKIALDSYVEGQQWKVVDTFYLNCTRPFVVHSESTGAPHNVAFLTLIGRADSGDVSVNFRASKACRYNFMATKLAPARVFLKLKVLFFLA
jgi:hypothetical protein